MRARSQQCLGELLHLWTNPDGDSMRSEELDHPLVTEVAVHHRAGVSELEPSNTNERLIGVITASPVHQGNGAFPHPPQEGPCSVVQGQGI